MVAEKGTQTKTQQQGEQHFDIVKINTNSYK